MRGHTPFSFAFEFIKDKMLPQMKEGEALQSERELSEKIGVARTVIREAKAALWALELITIEQGKPSRKL